MNQLMRDRQIGILAIQETHLKLNELNSLNQLFEKSLVVHTSEDTNNANSKGVASALNNRLVRW